MAHTTIEPEDEDRYYAGDSLNIPIHFMDKNGDEPEPIPDEGHVEFRVKHERTDSDNEALVTKDSNEPNEITIDDEGLDDNECIVHIREGETDEAVDDPELEDVRLDSVNTFFHCRLFDDDDGRVTAVEGEWEMWAS